MGALLTPSARRLALLAALSVPLYAVLPRLAARGPDDPLPFLAVFFLLAALYLAAVRTILQTPEQRIWLIVALGVGARLWLLPAQPSLSGDPYRYVWDARVAAHGFNPYQVIPDDPSLRQLRDRVLYPRMGYHQVPTLYPPGAQALFGLAYRLWPDQVLMIKLLLVLCDLGGAWLLLRLERPGALILIYLWNPLVILETAHSGHVDAAAIALTLGAALATLNDRPRLAGVLLGLATLVKIYPILLLPMLIARRDARAAVSCGLTVAVGYVLAWTIYGSSLFGYLGQYVQHDSINASLYNLAEWGSGRLGLSISAAHRIPLLILACEVVWLAWQRWRGRYNPLMLGLIITISYLLLAPTLLPWYATALVPLSALLLGDRAMTRPLSALPMVCLVFSCMVPLEYTHHHYSDGYWPAVVLEYGVVYGLLLAASLPIIAHWLRPDREK